MPPLSTQEQDDEQSNDEAENCSTFGQSCTQQQVGLDLTGSFRLAADGLRCLAGGNADADAAPIPVSAAIPAPRATSPFIIISPFNFLINFLFASPDRGGVAPQA